MDLLPIVLIIAILILIVLLIYSLNNRKTGNSQLQQQLDVAQTVIGRLKKQNEEYALTISDLKSDLTLQNENLDKARDQLTTLGTHRDDLVARLGERDASLNQLKTQLGVARNSSDELAVKLAEKDKALAQLQDQLQTITSIVSSTQ